MTEVMAPEQVPLVARALVAKQEVLDRALDLVTPHEPVFPVDETTRRPRTYPVVPDHMRQALHRCLVFLAGMDDGAVMRDGMGFNKIWTGAGTSLARGGIHTDGQAWLAARIVTTHRRQVPSDKLIAAGVAASKTTNNSNGKLKGVANEKIPCGK